jgi:hypothetical protein
MSGAIQPTLEPAEPQALVPAPVDAQVAMIQMIERIVTNPEVDVEKLERVLEMQRRIRAEQAKIEFDEAHAAMEAELPVIDEKGRIVVEGEVRSKYARYEDIIEVCRPIYTAHGFSLRHKNQITDTPKGQILKVIGILSHKGGHSETDEFENPPDKSGKKNDIQAYGSTRSYGQRYTTIALLNIVTRGVDDDGKAAGRREVAPEDAPAGYGEWRTALAAAAENGTRALMAAWNGGNPKHRSHLTRTERETWESLKERATEVGL